MNQGVAIYCKNLFGRYFPVVSARSLTGSTISAFDQPLMLWPHGAVIIPAGVYDETLEDLFTEQDEVIQRWREMLLQAHRVLEMLKASRSSSESPEVFDLRPLASRRVNVKIRRVESARFHFIADEEA